MQRRTFLGALASLLPAAKIIDKVAADEPVAGEIARIESHKPPLATLTNSFTPTVVSTSTPFERMHIRTLQEDFEVLVDSRTGKAVKSRKL